MGAIIHYFKVQPFIVTLAGMFFARGMCFVISLDAITISHPFYRAVSLYRKSRSSPASTASRSDSAPR